MPTSPSHVRFTLEQLHIPQPCHVDWATMTGDARTRFCGQCGKHVHDLSARTRAEAEAVLADAGGRLCVQYRVTPDGQVITQDAPPRGRWRGWATLSMAVATLLVLVGCRRDDDNGPGDVRLAGTPMPMPMIRTAGMVDTSRIVVGDVAPPATRPAATQPTTPPAATRPAVIRGEPAEPATRAAK